MEGINLKRLQAATLTLEHSGRGKIAEISVVTRGWKEERELGRPLMRAVKILGVALSEV